MASYNASIYDAQVSTTRATNRPEANSSEGKLRYFMSSYTVPVGGLSIGDVIRWIDLPAGARLVGYQTILGCAAGTASSTLNVGDSASAARYLAASSVASAAEFTCKAAETNGATGFVTTAKTTVQSVVAGAGLLAGQVITLKGCYVQD